MTSITIDTDEMSYLATEAGHLVFQKEAEEKLLRLLAIEEQIQVLIKEVKEKIAQAGQSIDPNFKGVIGDQVRAIYRQYGDKYGYEPEMRDYLESAGFMKKNEQFKIKSDEVEKYVKKHKALPDGIVMKERAKVISLTISDDKDALELHSSEHVGPGENK